MDDVLTCPHCGAVEGKVTVESVATLTYSGRTQAEIDIGADLVRETATKAWEKKKVVVDEDRVEPTRALVDFRRDGDPHALDLIEWDGLELDDEHLIAFCWQCQGDVTDAFRALLDRRVPLPSREPTDDEIYNRPGVEGGIAYPLSGEAMSEHDWRL